MSPSHELAGVIAEALREAVVEAVAAEVRAVLERHAVAPPARLLTVAEAAKIANVHAETLRRAIKAGRLRSVSSLGRHPRIRPEDLAAFLEPRVAP